MKLFKKSLLLLLAVIFIIACSKTKNPTPQPTPKPTVPTPPAPGVMSITSISPDYGKAGTEIIVTGANFSTTATENKVTLGGKPAVVSSASATQLKINAPADGTHGTVQVQIGTAVATSSLFYYEPEVTSLNVTTAKVGDVVVITGKHFGTITTDFEVKFAGTLAEITAAASTSLTVKVPTGAVAGLVTVARKSKTPVNGPNFTIQATSGTTSGFTINNNSVTITSLIKSSGVYGQIICMTVDEERNVAYAGTTTQIIKIDLTTNAVSTILNNSTFITIPYGKPSAMDVDANGKIYLLAEMYGAIPTSGSNVYIIDPVAKTAKTAGNRFVGVSLVGSFAINTPFQVLATGEIIAFDQSFKQLCKFSADLSVRTVIYTLPLVLENVVQLIKVNPTTVRIVLTGISDKYYYDYTTSLGPKTTYNEPTGYKMISQTIGGSNKYGVAAEMIMNPNSAFNINERATYTVGRLDNAQTAWIKKGSFVIESYNEINTIKYYNFIGLNGRPYFYADKNGNMYAQILANSNVDAGIYKFSLN